MWQNTSSNHFVVVVVAVGIKLGLINLRIVNAVQQCMNLQCHPPMCLVGCKKDPIHSYSISNRSFGSSTNECTTRIRFQKQHIQRQIVSGTKTISNNSIGQHITTITNGHGGCHLTQRCACSSRTSLHALKGTSHWCYIFW